MQSASSVDQLAPDEVSISEEVKVQVDLGALLELGLDRLGVNRLEEARARPCVVPEVLLKWLGARAVADHRPLLHHSDIAGSPPGGLGREAVLAASRAPEGA
eukprot:CAMPEP_0179933208 /NCGR_PEP_ID=MMETSP0983-20121128/11725_1 /TAXON_ID=483367 /ORGANISM="non described non described, Strain CCMP 2436" /LENGTH=101 /DNA_ID=CAMNT_0021837957 /DNA_START=200 /DNA_END=502 /DNA_ORIENTATION=+